MKNRIQLGALALVAAAGLLVTAACFDSLTVDQVQDQNHHNTVQEAKPSPVPSASPSPGGVQGAGPIVSIKVTFSDGSPGAGDKTLVVGEQGVITASPLNAAGIDPCKGIPNSQCTLYGQADIEWKPGDGVSVTDCSSVVQAKDAGEEAYNLDLKACNAGSFEVFAVFRGGLAGVPNGSLKGTVVKP